MQHKRAPNSAFYIISLCHRIGDIFNLSAFFQHLNLHADSLIKIPTTCEWLISQWSLVFYEQKVWNGFQFHSNWNILMKRISMNLTMTFRIERVLEILKLETTDMQQKWQILSKSSKEYSKLNDWRRTNISRTKYTTFYHKSFDLIGPWVPEICSNTGYPTWTLHQIVRSKFMTIGWPRKRPQVLRLKIFSP